MTTQVDRVSWFELPADDVARAGTFYSRVFGWSTSDMGGGSLIAQTTPSDEQGTPTEPGAINGDISPRSESFDKPLIVITVEDIDAKIAIVEEAGGSVVLPRTEVPEMNMIWSIITDTEGNKVGILQNL
jgi:predicted enzyme related to lactoylglutathione lyase